MRKSKHNEKMKFNIINLQPPEQRELKCQLQLTRCLNTVLICVSYSTSIHLTSDHHTIPTIPKSFKRMCHWDQATPVNGLRADFQVCFYCFPVLQNKISMYHKLRGTFLIKKIKSLCMTPGMILFLHLKHLRDALQRLHRSLRTIRRGMLWSLQSTSFFSYYPIFQISFDQDFLIYSMLSRPSVQCATGHANPRFFFKWMPM